LNIIYFIWMLYCESKLERIGPALRHHRLMPNRFISLNGEGFRGGSPCQALSLDANHSLATSAVLKTFTMTGRSANSEKMLNMRAKP